MTETYGVLTVGAVNSGTVALGQEVTGAGVPAGFEAIDKYLGGSGQGSQWIVKIAPSQTVTGDMTMTATPLQVDLNWDNQSITGNNGAQNDFYDIMPQGSFGFDNNPSTLSYASGTAAAALGLTQASKRSFHRRAASTRRWRSSWTRSFRRPRAKASGSVRFRATVPNLRRIWRLGLSRLTVFILS